MMEVVATVSLVQWATLLCLVEMIKMESVVEAHNVTESSADDDVLPMVDDERRISVGSGVGFGPSDPLELSGCAHGVQQGVPSTVIYDGQEIYTVERTSPLEDEFADATYLQFVEFSDADLVAQSLLQLVLLLGGFCKELLQNTKPDLGPDERLEAVRYAPNFGDEGVSDEPAATLKASGVTNMEEDSNDPASKEVADPAVDGSDDWDLKTSVSNDSSLTDKEPDNMGLSNGRLSLDVLDWCALGVPMVHGCSVSTQCANWCDPVVKMAKYMVHGNWNPGIENLKLETLHDEPKEEGIYSVSTLEAERSGSPVLVSEADVQWFIY